ncbi:MAG: hypothetical protein GX062_04015 [Firmicutes bacterium]|jgi:multisubunit Na+/H+ antiporter MnhB subunit|nr:hypothetical protein [Bacillota bacterium]
MRPLILALILTLTAVCLVLVALEMPPLGNPSAPSQASPTTAYYNKQAVTDTGCLSHVAAIVCDYRAYDTLGETTVLFTAIAAILALKNSREGSAGE